MLTVGGPDPRRSRGKVGAPKAHTTAHIRVAREPGAGILGNAAAHLVDCDELWLIGREHELLDAPSAPRRIRG